jgi:hypothetical protein
VVSSKDGNRYVWMKGSQEAVAKDRLHKRDYSNFEEVLGND